MDEMGDFDIPDLHDNQPKRKNKRMPFESQVCRIAMPDWPEEAMTGGAPKKRQVCVYLEGNGKLWIHTDDLEWLIRYLWIQQQLKGVSAVSSDDEGPDAPKRMDLAMTPEKFPEPQQDKGHLHDKWAAAP